MPRLCECCRQSEIEVVSNSSNKSHQTEGLPFSRALYDATLKIYDQGTNSHDTLHRQEEPPTVSAPIRLQLQMGPPGLRWITYQMGEGFDCWGEFYWLQGGMSAPQVYLTRGMSSFLFCAQLGPRIVSTIPLNT